MDNDAVAVYRNETENLEVEVRADACDEYNPLDDESWLRFLTIRNHRYRHGTDQLERNELDAEVAEAEKNGAIVLPVHMMAHGAVGFSLGEYSDSWDSGQCGFLVISDEGLDKAGIPRERAVDKARALLEQYSHWCNGHGFGYTLYKTQRCNLGEVHRTKERSVRGYLGISHEETVLLEDAGIVEGRPPKLRYGWVEIR